MVTVHRAFGYRFVIFANDHAPAHVHVLGQGGEARIWLDGPAAPSADRVAGIARADMRRIMAEVVAQQSTLLEAWRQLHG